MEAHQILKQFVKDYHLTQREVARRIGIDETALSHILAGRRPLAWATYGRWLYAFCWEESPFYLPGASAYAVKIGLLIVNSPLKAPQRPEQGGNGKQG